MGIGDWVSGVFGSENKERAKAPELRDGAYQYGGWSGGAHEAASRYRNQSDQAQKRQGVQANYGDANASRQDQSSLAGAMRMRAMGLTPSISQMQADRQMQQATAAQSSAAASARGAGAMALAQQNAANNTANAQSAISNQAQINAANERMQAEQAAFGAFGSMRGQDQQQAQFDAQMQDSQRARNDAMTMAMTQNEIGVQNAQMAAQMNQQAQQSANQLGAAGINAGVAGQNAATAQRNAESVVSFGKSMAGAVAGAADGGPVKGGKPYVVGERGPEVIVPKKDAVVIPAEHTKAIMSPGDIATSTWGTGKGISPEMARSTQWESENRGEAVAARDRDRDKRLATSGGMAIAGGPGTGTTLDEPLRRRDAEAISSAKAKQAEGVDLSDDEQRQVRGAQYRAGMKQDQKPTLASALSESAASDQEQLAKIDVGYHGPNGGYMPPQLIQISGFRELGGPMSAGNAYMVGESGPEMVMPKAPKVDIPGVGDVSQSDIAQHSTQLGRLELVHKLPSLGDMQRTGAKNLGPPPAMPAGASSPIGKGADAWMAARADGGPMRSGGKYVVGERGPETVIPLYEPPGLQLHMGDDGRAFYQSEPAEDDGRPSLAKAMSPQPSTSPVAARAPVKIDKAPPPPKKKKTEEELLREADAMMAAMREEHAQRMAQGPAVSLSSRMRAK